MFKLPRSTSIIGRSFAIKSNRISGDVCSSVSSTVGLEAGRCFPSVTLRTPSVSPPACDTPTSHVESEPPRSPAEPLEFDSVSCASSVELSGAVELSGTLGEVRSEVVGGEEVGGGVKDDVLEEVDRVLRDLCQDEGRMKVNDEGRKSLKRNRSCKEKRMSVDDKPHDMDTESSAVRKRYPTDSYLEDCKSSVQADGGMTSRCESDSGFGDWVPGKGDDSLGSPRSVASEASICDHSLSYEGELESPDAGICRDITQQHQQGDGIAELDRFDDECESGMILGSSEVRGGACCHSVLSSVLTGDEGGVACIVEEGLADDWHIDEMSEEFITVRRRKQRGVASVNDDNETGRVSTNQSRAHEVITNGRKEIYEKRNTQVLHHTSSSQSDITDHKHSSARHNSSQYEYRSSAIPRFSKHRVRASGPGGSRMVRVDEGVMGGRDEKNSELSRIQVTDRCTVTHCENNISHSSGSVSRTTSARPAGTRPHGTTPCSTVSCSTASCFTAPWSQPNSAPQSRPEEVSIGIQCDLEHELEAVKHTDERSETVKRTAVIQDDERRGAVIQGDERRGAVIQGDGARVAVIKGDERRGAVIHTFSLSNAQTFIYTVVAALLYVRSRVTGQSYEEAMKHPIEQTQLENQSVTLTCDLPMSDPPDVTWGDLVYNTGTEPCHIFSSLDNPDRILNNSHPNHINFEIQPQLHLIINSLNMNTGPGLYFCTSRDNGTQHTRVYNLGIGTEPKCEGEVNLKDGDTATFSCEARYSGNILPRLEWFQMDSVNKSIKLLYSEDEFDIRMARQTVKINVTHADDGDMIYCQMSFANIPRTCDMTLNVKYAVRDVIILPKPESGKIPSDKFINCSAMGNPLPRVQLQTSPFNANDHKVGLEGSAAVAGSMKESSSTGFRLLYMKQEWQKKVMHFYCSATNEHNDKSHVIYTNITALISEPEKSTGQKIVKHIEKALDETPVVIGVIVGVSLILLVIIITVTLVRKHKEKQRRKRAKAAAAEAKQQSTTTTTTSHHYNGKSDDGKKRPVAV